MIVNTTFNIIGLYQRLKSIFIRKHTKICTKSPPVSALFQEAILLQIFFLRRILMYVKVYLAKKPRSFIGGFIKNHISLLEGVGDKILEKVATWFVYGPCVVHMPIFYFIYFLSNFE